MELFRLDERLARDSQSILQLPLSDLRLSRDSRWPWLILVPRRNDITEIFELSKDDQIQLLHEQVHVGAALKPQPAPPRSTLPPLAMWFDSSMFMSSPALKPTRTGLGRSGAMGWQSPIRTQPLRR